MKKLILLLMLLPILSGSAIAGQCTNVTIEGDWKHHKYASHRCDKMNYELRHIAETCRYKDRNYNTIMVRGYRNNRVHTWLEDIYTNEIIDATYPNVDYSKQEYRRIRIVKFFRRVQGFRRGDKDYEFLKKHGKGIWKSGLNYSDEEMKYPNHRVGYEK